ncbi:hypothetical protein BRC72_09290 [Halobacteriales archaeon QH_7_66_36]|nr:MAG: hypothetical protein BRC72_09290 [Halobacteriales archaeon QH_7_66_36]
MASWRRAVSTVGAAGLFGGTHVLFAVGWTALTLRNGDLAREAVVQFLLLGAPGIIILAGGDRLRRALIDPSAYPRIIGWTVGCFTLPAVGETDE